MDGFRRAAPAFRDRRPSRLQGADPRFGGGKPRRCVARGRHRPGPLRPTARQSAAPRHRNSGDHRPRFGAARGTPRVRPPRAGQSSTGGSSDSSTGSPNRTPIRPCRGLPGRRHQGVDAPAVRHPPSGHRGARSSIRPIGFLPRAPLRPGTLEVSATRPAGSPPLAPVRRTTQPVPGRHPVGTRRPDLRAPHRLTARAWLPQTVAGTSPRAWRIGRCSSRARTPFAPRFPASTSCTAPPGQMAARNLKRVRPKYQA